MNILNFHSNQIINGVVFFLSLHLLLRHEIKIKSIDFEMILVTGKEKVCWKAKLRYLGVRGSYCSKPIGFFNY